MKAAYIFSSQSHTVSYKLGKMILPRLKDQADGIEVVGLRTNVRAWRFQS